MKMMRVTLNVALLALGTVAANAQGGQEREWISTFVQIQGNTTSCLPSGWQTVIRTDGKSLAGFGPKGDRQTWLVQLKPDGSADTETDFKGRMSGRVRIKVAAGEGPRPIEFLWLREVCGYRSNPT